ncbi:MAG: FUSC family protein [Acidimicrobiales bacterium]|nr:FUSC family protein [Acidimicrobiales bacterium]
MHETWSQLEHDAFVVEEQGFDIVSGIVGMLVTTVPLAVGVATDQLQVGMSAALGAMNVVLGTPTRGPHQLRWGSITLAGTVAATAIATLLAPYPLALLTATVAIVAATAELRRFGRSGAMTGFIIGAVLVINGGLPEAPDLPRTVAAAGGGGAGLVLALAATELRRRVLSSGGTAPADPPSPIPPTRLHAHAARTSIAVGAGQWLAHVTGLMFGYWVPLTTLAVLQPEPHASWVRMVQRSAGTLVGAGIVAFVLTVTTAPWVLVGCVGAASLSLFALRERSYYWLVLCLTPTALLIIGTGVPVDATVAGTRVLATAIGIAFAAAATGATAWWVARHPEHTVPSPAPASSSPPAT